MVWACAPWLARAGHGPYAFKDAYARVAKSVVGVEARTPGLTRHGTGFVIAEDGLVVCASQTVERSESVRVRVGDSWLQAQVVEMSSSLRVALLKVAAVGMQPAAVARKATLRVGDWVVAVENRPKGDTWPIAGTVSHVPHQPTGNAAPPVVLVDAPTAPGSPLVNLQGEVVGISLGRMDPHRGRATQLEDMRAFLAAAAVRARQSTAPLSRGNP
jgi:S1-C subfamily serine protease